VYDVTMKAWSMAALGGPERLELVERPRPEPARGELVVRVAAAALNFSDLLMLRGEYQVRPPLPFVPGQEIAGVVDASADDAWRVGDRIAAKVHWGGFAEQALVREEMAIRLPAQVSFSAGATLPVVWPTAWIALFDRARLQAGETVLVLAAAGGVGSAGVQLAHSARARVIAAAGGVEKLALCRALGADETVDYSQPEWLEQVSAVTGGRGADVIFDPVGADIGEASFKCLARNGRLLIVGFAGGRIPALRTNRLLLKNTSALGVYWSHEQDAALLERAFADLWRRHAAGELHFAAEREYPFGELPRALADLAARRTTGKCVLVA
jgi:NADPH:quinone reductase